MYDLFEGARKFTTLEFPRYAETFKKLCRRQAPHTLFIGCSDSRIMPNLLTGSVPGELFIIRNIANIVPPYQETSAYISTSSSIEYAVKALQVTNIIVCGHSNCGGCCALLMDEEELTSLPHTKKWLELSTEVRRRVNRTPGCVDDERNREETAEKLNVVEQLKNLLTYPYIQERYSRGDLNILGWYYDIETGEIFNYDRKKEVFFRIE